MTVRQDTIGNLIGRYVRAASREPAARRTLTSARLAPGHRARRRASMTGRWACWSRWPLSSGCTRAAAAAVRHRGAGLCRRGGRALPHRLSGQQRRSPARSTPPTLALSRRRRHHAGRGHPRLRRRSRALAGDARAADDLLGYCEVHIEQGPVLEARELPVGVVSAIAGQSRVERAVHGRGGPRGHGADGRCATMRSCAAAEFVLAVEALARAHAGSGRHGGPDCSVEPGASNVIPGRVTLSLDVRHPDDARAASGASARLQRAGASSIAAARGVDADLAALVQEHGAVPCAPGPDRRCWRGRSRRLGYPGCCTCPAARATTPCHAVGLTPSRDAVRALRRAASATTRPSRSRRQDVAVAIAVLERFLTMLAERSRRQL